VFLRSQATSRPSESGGIKSGAISEELQNFFIEKWQALKPVAQVVSFNTRY
jgi:hypothetical protein